MAEVILKNVRKLYGNVVAVKDFPLDIADQEFVALVGPSGCGKSTTLRMVAGLEEITGGTIAIGDRVVNDLQPKDRDIAMVFQNYALYQHMTVYDNLAFGLRNRKTPESEIEAAIKHAAKVLSIEPLLARRPRQLSGGQQQRVALGRCIVRNPKVFLFDEPLSNLDAQLRHQAREDIMLLHQQRPTPTVYVTHDQSEAMALGDRIAVMRAGKLEQIGTGQELYSHPVNLFVAFFIGAPSINLFDGRLTSADGEIYVETQAFKALIPAQFHQKIGGHVGKAVKIGIRPEDMHVPKQAPFAVTDDNTIHGVLNEIEPSATGSIVYLSSLEGDIDYVAMFRIRLPASYIGKEIPLGINMERIHLFDVETERSLLSG